MATTLSQLEFVINVLAIGGIIYHVGKREGEVLQRVDAECDKMQKQINALRLDFLKVTSELQQIGTMIKTREEILRNDIKNERNADLQDFKTGQENDDRRIKKCVRTVEEIEKQLQDKQIYLRLPRNTHF